ncbi:minor capsid protein [Paenibacillus tritici]|uniref:Minor capsid protein n=1 Tax=Paenibacillus tritici TaxID=1873425 RepID=A0ABX2DLJ6_9BACL|nr:minor capsid protein [Paenibacillus tritici]NQX45335.1 minor capsid protein [Paenibacillus tritici]
MKTAAYWSGRMEQLNESLLNKGVPFTKAMQKEYRKAQIAIQTDVNNFYQRFADNNGLVSLAEAKRVLRAGELKEFKWTVEDYIARGKENAIDQRWMRELENASIRVRVTRLESIQLQMRQHIEEMSAKRLAGTTGLLGNVYKDGYYRSIFELQKGAGIGASFAKIDKRQLEAILSAPWAPDGSNFSSRIWADRVRLNGELRNLFTQGLISGKTSKQMIQQLQDRLGVSYRAAERLILTESAYFAGQSRLAGYKELGVEQFRYMATLDKRTSPTCRDLDGEVFEVTDAQPGVNYPPMHVYCRSTTIPHYDDNIKERVARDDDGKTYKVPEDIDYPEWEKKYAPEAAQPAEVETPPKKGPETPLPTIEIPGQPDKGLPIPGGPTSSVIPREDTNPAPRPFKPAESLQAAEEVARKDYGFDDVDYTGMDLESANDLNKAIDGALQELPGIKGFVKTLKAVDTDEYVAQVSMGLREAPDILHAELRISTHYYNSTGIDDIIKASTEAKFWPVGANRQSIFIHEFGHVAEYAHALKIMGGWTGVSMTADELQIASMRIARGTLSKEIVGEALAVLGIQNVPGNIMDELSQYATTNTKETLAEAIGEAVGIENPRRLSVKIKEILKRKMKEVGL